MIPGSTSTTQHIHLAHPDKLAIAEHSISRGHSIELQDTKILPTKSRYMDRLIREGRLLSLLPHYTSLSSTLARLPPPPPICHWALPHLTSPIPHWSAQVYLDCRLLYNVLSFRARLIHRPDDGGSARLWNVSQLQRDYKVLHPRRL
jgi:hypothetical protein